MIGVSLLNHFSSFTFSVLGPPSRLRRLRRTPSFARPAIRSHGRQAVRRMVEAGGIEPPSETTSRKYLRAYSTIKSRVRDVRRQACPNASIRFYELERPDTKPSARPASQRFPAQQISAVPRCANQLGSISEVIVRIYCLPPGFTRNEDTLGAQPAFRMPRRNQSPPCKKRNYSMRFLS